MSHLHFLSHEERDELDKIVAYCRSIQGEFTVLRYLLEKRDKYIADLINICRQCNDRKCESRVDCEVKKAYALLVKITR